MSQTTSKSSLSTPRRRLVELLQVVNFGRLERLEVRGGEPVLDPRPAVVRECKFASENGPRPEVGRSDFVLKAQHLELMQLLDTIGDGVIAVLVCKHGLPFSCEVPG